jgi:hypothetical protein
MSTSISTFTGDVETEKAALVAPAGTVTVAGTHAAAG